MSEPQYGPPCRWKTVYFHKVVKDDELQGVLNELSDQGYNIDFSPLKDDPDVHEQLDWVVDAYRLQCMCGASSGRKRSK